MQQRVKKKTPAPYVPTQVELLVQEAGSIRLKLEMPEAQAVVQLQKRFADIKDLLRDVKKKHDAENPDKPLVMRYGGWEVAWKRVDKEEYHVPEHTEFHFQLMRLHNLNG